MFENEIFAIVKIACSSDTIKKSKLQDMFLTDDFIKQNCTILQILTL